MERRLVIIPCGQGKIWDKFQNRGPVNACDVYTGAPFKINKEFAEHFGDKWVILSAKYGFIPPDFTIPGPYNVTFKKKSTNPVSLSTLKAQIKEQNLDDFNMVICLGGKEYRSMVDQSFANLPSNIIYPFAGLTIGKMMQATKRAIKLNEIHPDLNNEI